MNTHMWRKALQVIPQVSKEEWDGLDVISKWLISTRAAVLIMTFISAAIAGILAFQAGKFNLGPWLLLVVGLLFSHAMNNLLNDYIDVYEGIDREGYFRTEYAPHPILSGQLTVGWINDVVDRDRDRKVGNPTLHSS